jgi:hypothetical protein
MQMESRNGYGVAPRAVVRWPFNSACGLNGSGLTVRLLKPRATAF